MVSADKVSNRALAVALVGAGAVGLALLLGRPSFAEPAVALPSPVTNEAANAAVEKAVLAGGCFWGVQAVFQHVKGVQEAI